MSIVFTNGVFDIIHAEHIKLLRHARSLGNMLVVAINSDESAKRLKGPTRPIFNQEHRKDILMEMRCIDDVIIFDEDTPINVIMRLRPQFLVKGPEAAESEIPGADFVKSCGGRVVTPNWKIECSTSKIIKQVLTDTDRPLPLKCTLDVKGKEQEKLEDYSFMFNKQPDGYRPVLYKKGKRVTDAYLISLQHHQPRDKEGCSA